jgi:four helix bundle protein
MNSKEQLLPRTKNFAVRVMNMVDTLPNRRAANVVGNQVLRSATSVGANYRAARRARSPAEFCSKMGIVEEEADESVYWLELLIEANLVRAARLKDLIQEANEIVAMTVASIRTARSRKESNVSQSQSRSPRSAQPSGAATVSSKGGSRVGQPRRSSRRSRPAQKFSRRAPKKLSPRRNNWTKR